MPPKTRQRSGMADSSGIGSRRSSARRVAILGLGLMGASLGMALRATNHTITGYDQAPGVADRALARGAVDVAVRSAVDAVAAAELVVLAVPVLAIRELLLAISAHVSPDALVTDIGSVKSPVVAWAEEYLPQPQHFIGGHPMVGREHSGVEAALPELYTGCIWCLTPTDRTASRAVDCMAALTTELGAHPFLLDSNKHDAAVALVSHLPRIAATALMLTATNSTEWPLAQTLAAGGFRDTSRVASSSSRVARDICLSNRHHLVDALDAYQQTLAQLRQQIVAGDETVEGTFESAKQAREMWLDKSNSRLMLAETGQSQQRTARRRLGRIDR